MYFCFSSVTKVIQHLVPQSMKLIYSQHKDNTSIVEFTVVFSFFFFFFLFVFLACISGS